MTDATQSSYKIFLQDALISDGVMETCLKQEMAVIRIRSLKKVYKEKRKTKD